jgi:hypothetical protein
MAVAEAPAYAPYERGAFRWRLGLRPLDLDDWIQLGPQAHAELARKREVLDVHHATAFGAIDGVDEEAAEVLDAIVAHLVAPGRPHADRAAAALRAEAVAAARSSHPLDAAGLLVPEDLVLLVERDGRLVVGAGSVCFPNRWDLRGKLGLALADVHAPVARLNEQLADPIDRFLERLTPERSFWRLGWGVLDTPELYQPLDGTAPPRPTDPTASDVHLRVERETLRRFPRTGAVLFTIRTYLTPLSWFLGQGDEGLRLADAVDALPADVAAYKQLDELGPWVVAWLREHAHAGRASLAP